MKAQQQDDWLFSSSVIQTHLYYDHGQTTRFSPSSLTTFFLLQAEESEVSPFGNSPPELFSKVRRGEI